jgi:hypothetical protein
VLSSCGPTSGTSTLRWRENTGTPASSTPCPPTTPGSTRAPGGAWIHPDRAPGERRSHHPRASVPLSPSSWAQDTSGLWAGSRRRSGRSPPANRGRSTGGTRGSS